MFDAFEHRLDDTFPVIRATDQIQRIKRNYDTLQRLLNVTITGQLPDFLAETQVALKESVQILGLRFEFGFLVEFIQDCDVMLRRSLCRQ